MTDSPDLTWMLEEHLLRLVPGTRYAVLLSADGLLRAHAGSSDRDEAERVAAGLAGLKGTFRAISGFCHATYEGWQQTLSEFDEGFIFLVAAGPGAYLGVSTTKDVDLEGVSSQLQKLVQRLGDVLTTPPRPSAQQGVEDWFAVQGPGSQG